MTYRPQVNTVCNVVRLIMMMVLEMADLDFDLVMKSKYVVVDAYWVQGQKLLYRAEHVKHDGSETIGC